MHRPSYLDRINDIPLKYKFILVYVFCVLIPIVSMNLAFLNEVTSMVREREMENLRISMDRAKYDLEDLVKSAVAVSHSVSSDRFLCEMLERKYDGVNEFYDIYYAYLRDRINRYASIYNHISELSIYTTNHTMLSGGNYLFLDEQARKKEWYATFVKSGAPIMLCAYKERLPGRVASSDQRLSVVRRLNVVESAGDFRHFVKVNIDINQVFEIFNREVDYINICLVDQENRVIFAPYNNYFQERLHFSGRNGIQEFSGALGANPKDSIVLDYNLGAARYLQGWRILGIADKRLMFRAEKRAYLLIFGLALASMFLATFLIFLIVRSFNYRILKLSKHMAGIEHQHFELIEMPEGKDEIGGLIRSFNLMAAKISSLINDVYKLNMQKKDLEIERVRAELNFLQSQINPHFLFNTLNAILVVCVKNNYSKVIEVIKFFAKTLRRLISWQDDLVMVEEELAFAEMYLKIEKFRFGEKFQYEINADEKALSCRIPKMTLQPLIENACKHGIQTIKGIGLIRMEVSLTAGNLRVIVEDNGSGMDQEKLELIRRQLAEEDRGSENIGICNVYRRLKLYYGDEVKFRMISKLKCGTRVLLEIPVDRRQPLTLV